MMLRINNLYQCSNSLTVSWMWSPRCEGNKRRVLLRNMWKVELEWWYKENANESSIPNSQKFLKLGEAPLFIQWSFSCLFGKHIVIMSLKRLHLELEPDLIISWLLFSHSVVSDSFWPYGVQHARLPVLHHLPKFAQTHFLELVMPSNYLILCHPLLLLPSIFPSIRVFTNESVLCIRWPKYWSFSLSMSPFQWLFRVDFYHQCPSFGGMQVWWQVPSVSNSQCTLNMQGPMPSWFLLFLLSGKSYLPLLSISFRI